MHSSDMHPSQAPIRSFLRRKLLLLSLLTASLSVLLSALHPRGSELRYLYTVLRLQMGTDSSRFMDQAWQTITSGHALYGTLFFGQHVKFIYPTSSLLLYWLAAMLHLQGSVVVRAIILLSLPATLLIVGEIVILKASEAGPLDAGERLRIRLLVALLGLLFYPLIYVVFLGQIQTLLTCLWTLSIWLWMRHRTALAGLTVALICIFKPALAIFVVWAVLRRQWRFLGTFVAAFCMIQTIAIALFGWQNEVDYLRVLNFLSHHGEVFIPNQTANGFLERWMRNGDMTQWSDTIYPPYNRLVYLGTLLSTAVLLLVGLLLPVVRRWGDSSADYILFGLLATVASPIAWEHHYSYFFAASMYYLAAARGRRRGIPALFAICFLVLSNAWPLLNRLANTSWNPLLSYHLYAGLGMAALIGVWMERDRAGSRAVAPLQMTAI